MSSQAQPPPNVQQLIDAGLIDGGLPAPYYGVFEDLSKDEIDLIVSVKRNLDEVAQSLRTEDSYTAFMVPF